MKRSEKELLNNLTGNSIISDIPLQNIRNAMKNVRYLTGNPLTKTTVKLDISIHYLNTVTGLLVAPAALPVDLQTQLPLFLFGLTDYYGGNLESSKLLTVFGNWHSYSTVDTAPSGIFNYSIFWGDIAPFIFPFTEFIESGDLIRLYTSNSGGVDYIAMVLIHCSETAYGTFLTSFVSELITVSILRYVVPIANVNQFNNSLVFGYKEFLGKTASDSIDPHQYISNTDFQQQICDIPINLPIDKSLFIVTPINFDCTNLSFMLFIEKVEALTHKYIK
jgi:hypothetical protein